MKVGDNIKHNQYGRGIIIPDVEGLCNNDEVFVKFEDPLPFPLPNNGKYSGFTTYHHKDIVYKKDLTI